MIIYHPEHSEKKSITYANIKPNTVCNSAFIKQMQRPKKDPLKYTETLHRATDDKNYPGKFKGFMDSFAFGGMGGLSCKMKVRVKVSS